MVSDEKFTEVNKLTTTITINSNQFHEKIDTTEEDYLIILPKGSVFAVNIGKKK